MQNTTSFQNDSTIANFNYQHYQAEVGKSITHDIGVMAKTIGIVNASQPG